MDKLTARSRYMAAFRALAMQLKTYRDARHWYEMGVLVEEAALWANKGYLPEEAAPLIAKGIAPETAAAVDDALAEEVGSAEAIRLKLGLEGATLIVPPGLQEPA